MMKLVFLTDAFYDAHRGHKEIERKTDRPYVMLQVTIDGVQWGIPMRSNIKHKYAIWTDKANHCGIDLTKAVVLEKPEEYIDQLRKPYLRNNEFAQLKKIDESWVAEKMRRYIADYKQAKQKLQIDRNRMMVQYSALQYFEKYI